MQQNPVLFQNFLHCNKVLSWPILHPFRGRIRLQCNCDLCFSENVIKEKEKSSTGKYRFIRKNLLSTLKIKLNFNSNQIPESRFVIEPPYSMNIIYSDWLVQRASWQSRERLNLTKIRGNRILTMSSPIRIQQLNCIRHESGWKNHLSSRWAHWTLLKTLVIIHTSSGNQRDWWRM